MLRQSMAWMHTWTGLLLGWVLYFMFVTGTAAYYDTEIDRWMKPEHPAPVAVEDAGALFGMALEHAQAEAPGADQYFIRLPTTRTYSPFVFVNWNGTDEAGERYAGSAELLADGSLVPDARETGGGQQLYRMHWTFHYIPRDVGEFIAGFAAFFMLAAIVSGIITHKKIFADFFTLRLAKGQRTWLDSHNVISVMTLPYQIMITFSGLIFVMTLFFAPVFVAQYGPSPDRQLIAQEVYGIAPEPERSGVQMPLTPIAPLVAQTQSMIGDEPVTRVIVKRPGDETAEIVVYGTIAGSPLRELPTAAYDGVTGELITFEPRTFRGSLTIVNALEGLHEALFAGPILRIVFFISGLLGCGMVATGLVLWTKNADRSSAATQRPSGTW